MIVISDTTPILAAKSRTSGITGKLYGNVLVPNAVYHELTENPVYIEEARIIKTTKFISLKEAENIKSVNVLRSVTGLDSGESEALIMYDEQKADLLFIDERKGHSVVKQLKVRYIGTAGIQMLAYDKGYIGQPDVKICLDTMINNNIRLGKKICNTIMAYVGLEERY